MVQRTQVRALDLQTSALPLPGAGSFRPDGTVYLLRFADCTVYISVRDEASKIDLNKAPEVLLAALFVSVGVDPAKAQSLADAIADFRDPDDLPRLHGAEETDYRDAGLACGPRNAPFQTVEDLQQVLGMTADIYRRVAPDLSVYSLTTTLPATADERLTKIVRDARFDPPPLAASPRIAFSVRAAARSANGGVFVREAIVQSNVQSGPWILS